MNKDKNFTLIEFTVTAENKRTIKMYKNFGFRTIGIIPIAIYYTDNTYADETLMILEL